VTLTYTGHGIGVARSIAIGSAYLLQKGMPEVVPGSISAEQVAAETARFRAAVAGAHAKLNAVREKIPPSTRSDIAAFIDTHVLMLNDDVLIEAPIKYIKQRHYTAEWALQVQRDELVRVFEAMQDPYLRTRKDDIDHVVSLVLKILLGQTDDDHHEDLRGRIILAQDLTPADTIMMRHQGVAAFVTEFGGPMSHTAILARSLGIPAVVGVHHATHNLSNGEQLIVDGGRGLVLAAADEATLIRYRGLIDESHRHAGALRKLIGRPTVTTDGERIWLMANIELPEDIETTRALDADGVGLYRTEYLYMNRSTPPGEEDHYQAYLQVLQGLDGIPVTIRTLDLGADKQIDGSCVTGPPACNPALGLRAIRLCLREPELFIPQLRAILRVASEGPVQIMVPMLCNLQELRMLKDMVEEAKASLQRQNQRYDRDIRIGGMIEVPAAALAADAFARELDFLSIGTNDLIQYTLAVDRMDDEVNYLYDPLHPSVLRLIQMVMDAGKRHNTPVSMCGEMAGDPSHIPLLLGMGLRIFSMQPGALLEAKRTLLQLDASQLLRQVGRLMSEIDQPGTVARLAALGAAAHH
jgi:phosphotransferase system enzyme I (PtsI)